jgi:RNA polymerase sigma factor (sigma-70 family)
MLVNLLCLYAKKNNITIIKGEPKVDIYDELLEDENEIDSLIEYKKSILGFDPLDEYEVENALLSGSEIDVENITRTYLPEIFELMLSRTEDKHFFKEMVDAGNEVLIKCIKTYDKKKHVSFDDYFKYMLNYVILNNVDKYYDRVDSPETKVIVVKDMSDAIVERVEMRKIINEMLDNSFLSNTERAIIEIRYGMFDGNLYDKKDTATLLGISEVTVDTIEEEALGKMRLLHAARLAREYKIPFTIHAGEAAGADSVKLSIEYGAKRIGHGVKSFKDLDVLNLAKENNVTYEVCPKSNLDTKAISSVLDYDLRNLLSNGINITINTDNLSVSSTNIVKEYELLNDEYDLTNEEFKKLLINSANAAFLNVDEKKILINKINEEIDRIRD